MNIIKKKFIIDISIGKKFVELVKISKNLN